MNSDKILPDVVVLNQAQWSVSVLGENAILLEPLVLPSDVLSFIRNTTFLLEGSNLPHVTDIVPAYTSIAVLIDLLETDIYRLIEKIQEITDRSSAHNLKPAVLHFIPVDYSLGLDWAEVEQQTGLAKANIIEKHCSVEYRVAMMGFLPGFVYLSGMDKAVFCKRKAVPRTRVPAGAVGIGGEQTGIYSFACPGGWQIIGRTDAVLFDTKTDPPNSLSMGDRVRFVVKRE